MGILTKPSSLDEPVIIIATSILLRVEKVVQGSNCVDMCIAWDTYVLLCKLLERLRYCVMSLQFHIKVNIVQNSWLCLQSWQHGQLVKNVWVWSSGIRRFWVEDSSTDQRLFSVYVSHLLSQLPMAFLFNNQISVLLTFTNTIAFKLNYTAFF